MHTAALHVQTIHQSNIKKKQKQHKYQDKNSTDHTLFLKHSGNGKKTTRCRYGTTWRLPKPTGAYQHRYLPKSPPPGQPNPASPVDSVALESKKDDEEDPAEPEKDLINSPTPHKHCEPKAP